MDKQIWDNHIKFVVYFEHILVKQSAKQYLRHLHLNVQSWKFNIIHI